MYSLPWSYDMWRTTEPPYENEYTESLWGFDPLEAFESEEEQEEEE